MEEKTTRFLNISLILVSLFCVFIFITQTLIMNLMGENAVRQLGVFYMSGISEQVTSHLATTIDLRLSQVESLVNSVPPGRASSSMKINLSYNARSAGFEYLAFFAEDEDFHMIYGSQVTADVSGALQRSIMGGRYNVCAGRDDKGTPLVLFAIPAIYPMEDGEKSVALVAGLPTSYLNDTLANNIQSSITEYAILRDDGSFVLQNYATEEENYFERVEHLYETYNGKDPAQYADEFRQALDADTEYTSEIMISGRRWNVYCTNLPNSEWHLLLKISHSSLDETVNLLQQRWAALSLGGCCLIIGALLMVFIGYYRLTKIQMNALDDARKTAEQAQLSAERSNRAKNEFLSNMSHDIRTPMNGIMGMTTIAIDNLDDPPRVRSCLKRIHVSSRHLLGLINDMLDMSKIENGNLTLNMAPVSLSEIMQNIMTIIQPQVQEKNQHFYLYAHDICYENVCSDRIRLSQILLNILGNAVKFTPEGGTIEADLYEEPSPKGDKYVRSHLHVKDNGIGMSEEFLSKIFDAFAREDNTRVEQAAGAGMGMTITKYIVDAMGGTIAVESKQGVGSSFHVTLDMEKTASQEKDLLLPRHNILVIDDDETAGRLAVSSLESIGLQAEAVTDMDQAFQLIEERRSGKEPYHVILLDWDMQGQDGIQIAGELASRFGPTPPTILLTDGEWDEVEARGEEAGIHAFIAKPLFRSGLYYGLRPLIDTKAPQQAPAPEANMDLTGRRLLLAEDNELNREIASELLSTFGLEIDGAENGQICVEKFEASDPGWYDAILMDLRMPVMTGFEATEAIRALDRKDARTIPIIAVSADAFADDIQKCLDYGMSAHTAKPLNPQKVLALLWQHLH